MFPTRNDFIAYATARYVTHLANAQPTEYQNAMVIAMTLANKLEMAGVAPWPRASWQVQPPAPAAATLPGTQPAAVVQQAQTPGAAPAQGQSNVELLMAANPHLFPQQGAAGGTVGQDPAPKVGTAQNPAPAGAVIAAHGEVQGNRETIVGPTITTPGIVSDVKPVFQPGVVVPNPTPGQG